MNTLLLSNDIGTVRIITDIIEMGFDDVDIELVSTIDSFYSRVVGSGNYYDLIVTDFRSDEGNIDNILKILRTDFLNLISKTVVVLQPSEFQEDLADGINYVVRPFSLDKIVGFFTAAVNSNDE